MKYILIMAIGLIGCAQPGPKFTQENGFVDVQVCGGYDIHLVEGIVYVCGGSPYSQTSNTGYVKASDGVYTLGFNADCNFQVTNGKLVFP